MTTSRARLVWLVALSVYTLSVFHRSSLGVAGLVAADRLHLSATQLAALTVLQLVVYAALQVPVGVLLDRFGSRAMLLTGLVLMSAGQLVFAFVDSFAAALVVRAAVGAGDAMVFVSVLRLITAWFPVRRVPVLAQLTGYLGQLGAIAASAPMTVALHELGWTATFAAASSIGVVLMVLLGVVVRDAPATDPARVPVRLWDVARSVGVVWANPGTRLGLWAHFTGQFSLTVFSLLWGYPFLVEGQGLSPVTAGNLLSVGVLAMVASGLVVGRVVARHPYHRSSMVLVVLAGIVGTWSVVLAWPGRAPLWLLVLLVVVMGTGGPAAMVGFDVVRTFHPAQRLGRASGIVNMGGFAASLLTMGLVGLVLDLRTDADSVRDLDDFRVALSLQYLIWAVGGVQVYRYRRKAKAFMATAFPGAVEELRRGVPFLPPRSPTTRADRGSPHLEEERVELGLHDKVLLVSGGASGLGRALVAAAREEGMRVAALDRDVAPLAGQDVLAVEADVTRSDQVVAAVERIEAELGPVDAAVTCAGIAPVAPAEDVTEEQWRATLDVNLTGTFLVAQAVARGMLERGRGALVLVGSSDSFGGHHGRTPYVASKHAVHGLARSLAVEWGPRGVRVNLLAPGPIDTPMLRRNNTEAQIQRSFYDRVPLRRLSAPVEQAHAALFLVSDAAAFVTGASLSVDGGLTAGHLTDHGGPSAG